MVWCYMVLYGMISYCCIMSNVTKTKKTSRNSQSLFCGATRSVFDPNNRLQTPSKGIKNDLKTSLVSYS